MDIMRNIKNEIYNIIKGVIVSLIANILLDFYNNDFSISKMTFDSLISTFVEFWWYTDMAARRHLNWRVASLDQKLQRGRPLQLDKLPWLSWQSSAFVTRRSPVRSRPGAPLFWQFA